MFGKERRMEEMKRLSDILAYGVAQASLTDAYIEEVKSFADQYGEDRIIALAAAARSIMDSIASERKKANEPKDLKEGGEENEVEAD